MLNAKIFAFFDENALMDCNSVMRRFYACNNKHPKKKNANNPRLHRLIEPLLYHPPSQFDYKW